MLRKIKDYLLAAADELEQNGDADCEKLRELATNESLLNTSSFIIEEMCRYEGEWWQITNANFWSEHKPNGNHYGRRRRITFPVESYLPVPPASS